MTISLPNSPHTRVYTRSPRNLGQNHDAQSDRAAATDTLHSSSQSSAESKIDNAIAHKNNIKWSKYTSEKNDQQIKEFFSSNIAKNILNEQAFAQLSQCSAITESMLKKDIFSEEYKNNNNKIFAFRELIKVFLLKKCTRGEPLELINAIHLELKNNIPIKRENFKRLKIPSYHLSNQLERKNIEYILIHIDLLLSKKNDPNEELENLSAYYNYLKDDSPLLKSCLDYYNRKEDFTHIAEILNFCNNFAGKRNEIISPLLLPILYNDEETLKDMLEAGIEPDWVPLEESSRDLFSFYSNRFPALKDIKNDEKPLAFALRHGSFSCASILLAYGADAKNILESTLNNLQKEDYYEFYNFIDFLYWAFNNKNNELEKIFTILNKIDFKNEIDRFGQFIFSMFRSLSSKEDFIAAILNIIKKIDAEERFNLVFQIIYLREVDLLDKVLKAGGNPNILDRQRDRYPLHHAVELKYYDEVRSLLKHGALVDSLTNRKLTALIIAVLTNYNDLIVALLQAKANPNLGSYLESHQLEVIRSMDTRLKRLLSENSFSSLELSRTLSDYLKSQGIELNRSITEQSGILREILDEIVKVLSEPQKDIPLNIAINFVSNNKEYLLNKIKNIYDELNLVLITNSLISLGLDEKEKLSLLLKLQGIKLDGSIIEQDEILKRVQNELFAIGAGTPLDIAIKNYDRASEIKNPDEADWQKELCISTIDTLLEYEAGLTPGNPILGNDKHPLFRKLKEKESSLVRSAD